MGGVNATSSLAALVLPGMYILTRPGRRRWRLAAWWAPAVLLATSWWLVPLLYQGRYGFNFLPYIEQSVNTTQTMSAAAALRGSGNWVAYLNFGLPWLAAGSVIVSLGVGGDGRRHRRRGRPGRAGPPRPAGGTVAARDRRGGRPVGADRLQRAARRARSSGPVQDLLNGPLSALRNVFKIEPVLAAVLALGIAHVLARAVWRWRRGPESPAPWPPWRGLAGLALPYLNGQALQPGSFTQVPAYWRAGGQLPGRPLTRARPRSWCPPTRTASTPGASRSTNRWNRWRTRRGYRRNLVPYTGGGVSDLMTGAEQAIESGRPRPGLAAYLARAGIRYVLVRNDLDPGAVRLHPAGGWCTHALRGSGFTRVAAFGPPVAGRPAPAGERPCRCRRSRPAYPPG